MIEAQLKEARQQTESVRKSILTGYERVIDELKYQVIELKAENVKLQEDTTDKISLIRSDNEKARLANKNKELMDKNREMEEACERLKNFAMDCQKSYSEF